MFEYIHNFLDDNNESSFLTPFTKFFNKNDEEGEAETPQNEENFSRVKTLQRSALEQDPSPDFRPSAAAPPIQSIQVSTPSTKKEWTKAESVPVVHIIENDEESTVDPTPKQRRHCSFLEEPLSPMTPPPRRQSILDIFPSDLFEKLQSAAIEQGQAFGNELMKLMASKKVIKKRKRHKGRIACEIENRFNLLQEQALLQFDVVRQRLLKIISTTCIENQYQLNECEDLWAKQRLQRCIFHETNMIE